MFMRLKLSAALTLGILGFATTAQAQSAEAARPTIVLVHGAFADLVELERRDRQAHS